MTIYKSLFLILFLLTIYSFNAGEERGTLILDLNNIEQPDGSIHIAIFDKARGFLNNNYEIFSKIVEVKGQDQIKIDIPAFEFGKYAIAVYHDLNANQRLDINMLGVPLEPFGFSNNVQVKFRKPKFEEVCIDFAPEKEKFSIALQKWSIK